METVGRVVGVAFITCPQCAVRTEEEIPADACLFFWACPACGAVVRPLEGDCCVFCSYGSRPCPTRGCAC
jgi:hypothetical protein